MLWFPAFNGNDELTSVNPLASTHTTLESHQHMNQRWISLRGELTPLDSYDTFPNELLEFKWDVEIRYPFTPGFSHLI